MSERGEAFDVAREAYEEAQAKLLELIDNPRGGAGWYRSQLKSAQRASNDAHRAMLAAWA